MRYLRILVTMLLAFVVSTSVWGESEARLREDMIRIRGQQEAIRKEYQTGIKQVNDDALKKLSGLKKGDKEGRMKISRERKQKMMDLREKFRENAEKLKGEYDSLRIRMKKYREGTGAPIHPGSSE